MKLTPTASAAANMIAQGEMDSMIREANMVLPVKQATRELGAKLAADLDAALLEAIERHLGVALTDVETIRGRLTLHPDLPPRRRITLCAACAGNVDDGVAIYTMPPILPCEKCGSFSEDRHVFESDPSQTREPYGETYALDGVPILWAGPVKLENDGSNMKAGRSLRAL